MTQHPRNHLGERMTHSSFRDLSPCLTNCFVSGPGRVRQNITEEEGGEENLVIARKQREITGGG